MGGIAAEGTTAARTDLEAEIGVKVRAGEAVPASTSSILVLPFEEVPEVVHTLGLGATEVKVLIAKACLQNMTFAA